MLIINLEQTAFQLFNPFAATWSASIVLVGTLTDHSVVENKNKCLHSWCGSWKALKNLTELQLGTHESKTVMPFQLLTCCTIKFLLYINHFAICFVRKPPMNTAVVIVATTVVQTACLYTGDISWKAGISVKALVSYSWRVCIGWHKKGQFWTLSHVSFTRHPICMNKGSNGPALHQSRYQHVGWMLKWHRGRWDRMA